LGFNLESILLLKLNLHIVKKTLLILAVAFSGVLTLSSCEKCSTCSYSYSIASQDSTVVMPEVCGSKKEVEEYENSAKAMAAANNGTISCESSK
jgi:hypothetical protein